MVEARTSVLSVMKRVANKVQQKTCSSFALIVESCRLSFLKGLLPFAVLSFLFLPVLSAFEVPQEPDGYVTDRAKLLSTQEQLELEKRLADFDHQTSTQIVVATFPSLDGENLEDISMQIAEAWKPGRKGKDNGVILLIFKNERKIRIEVGYGLEGVLTDALSGQIIRRNIAPHFRKGDYAAGIGSGVTGIMQAVQGEYHPEPRKGNPLVVLFFLVFFMGLGLSARKRAGRQGFRSGRFYGTGRYHSGGRGFGGFSGGSFGGGGASGGW